MADMSSVPKVPTLRQAFNIIGKIVAVDTKAASEIAATMLRVANKNRIDENRKLNDPHMERMAFFMEGAVNMSALKQLFGSPAFTGKETRQEDIDELMEAINRYLSRHPAIETKAGLNGMERKLVMNRAACVACNF